MSKDWRRQKDDLTASRAMIALVGVLAIFALFCFVMAFITYPG